MEKGSSFQQIMLEQFITHVLKKTQKTLNPHFGPYTELTQNVKQEIQTYKRKQEKNHCNLGLG